MPVAWPVNMHRRLGTGRSETVESCQHQSLDTGYYTDQRFGKITGMCVVNTVYVYVQLGELLGPRGPHSSLLGYTSSIAIQPAERYTHTLLLASRIWKNLEGSGSRHII